MRGHRHLEAVITQKRGRPAGVAENALLFHRAKKREFAIVVGWVEGSRTLGGTSSLRSK